MSLDIFDIISPDEEAPVVEPIAEDEYISGVKNEINSLSSKLNKYAEDKRKQNENIKSEFREFIKTEIAKIKPLNIEKVIERTIEKKIIEPRYIEPHVIQAPPPPPQIIKEVRVEVPVEKKDDKKYVEESKYLDLLVKISKLESQLKETRRMAESPIVMPGGSGVIGIPPPEPNPDGYVLTVASGKAKWKVSTGGSGASLTGFTVTNGNTLQTLNVTDTSLDELARIVGTIISQLQP